MIITIANAKGGSGKTTTAMHLAGAMTANGEPVLVVDIDPQGSATRWATRAAEAGEPLSFPVTTIPTRSIVNRIDIERAGRTAIIDPAPGNPEALVNVIDVADVVVIPVNASEDDIEMAKAIVDQCRASGIPHGVLLSRVRPMESLPAYHRDEMRNEGIHVFDTMIHELVLLRAFGARIDDPGPFALLLPEVMQLARTVVS